MAEPRQAESTVDETPAYDPLEAGLAAAFGPDSGPPLPAAGGVVQALGAASVHLREPDTEPADPVVHPHSDAVPAEAPARLQVQGEIARGGMGAILKGRDTDLGRDLAVKVLLETHAGKTELVQRFVEEAQISGQLQHPGITPVYELGRFADRRPYFTMKLVKGQTLAALLAARPDPAADLPKYIGIFGQVCQTLAYAHARGVIHRDLKPSNIMVGSFGEVQVMDWGLAKVLQEGAVTEEPAQPTVSVIQTPRSMGALEPAAHTLAGSVLGTPGYMAPEQARGAVDLVDRRADVFGLGAILCEILTGQPPFTGPNAEAMRKAQTAQLEDARRRLDGCGADADLVDLARRCLGAEPWERPGQAGEVAAAVTAYQHSVAERLRQAELAQAAEVARTEEAQATAAQERKAREAAQARVVAERRARRLTLGLAAALLGLVIIGAVGGLWVQRQAAERAAAQARQRQAVETALDRAAEFGRQGRWPEARAVLEETRERLGDTGLEDLRRRMEQAAGNLALVDRLEAIRLKHSTLVEGKMDNRGAERDYAEALREVGLAQEGEDAATVASRLRDSAVCDHLVAALDDWAAVTEDPERRAWLLEVARRADPDPWRDRFRDPQVWGDRFRLEGLAKELVKDEKELARHRPQVLFALAVALGRTKADAVPLLAAAQAHYPDDFWLNFELGYELFATKKRGEAVSFYRAAVAVRPSVAVAFNNLGAALRAKGQLDEAIQEYHKALQLDPKFANAHINLGIALAYKGQLDAAIQEFHKAIQLNPKNALAHYNFGVALDAKQQRDAAIQEYHKAIDLDPKLAEAHINLGCTLATKGQLDAAIQEFHKAIDLDPKIALAHHHLGVALATKGQLDAAIQEFHKAIDLDPKLTSTHFNLGNALTKMGQLDVAIQEYHKAIQLDPKDALAHYNLGIALVDKGELDAAIQEYHKAIDLNPRYPYAHRALGRALLKLGRFAEARQAMRRCLDLMRPEDPLRQRVTQQLHQCEQGLALEQKLPSLLAGKDQPANDAERLALAELCQQPFKKLYAASYRFYTEAFAHDGKLADSRQPQYRYDAACVAALAGCGQGHDADKLDEKERARLRQQALAWLRDDLACWTRHAAGAKPEERARVRQTLQYWQKDLDLAGIRDKDAVAKLPVGEREACQKLWAAVAEWLQKNPEKPK